MRLKSPFRLYKRVTNNKTIWYYTTYDEGGKRVRYSTGCSSKTSAMRLCMDLYKDGKLVPDDIKRAVIFAEYAKRWWIWGKCPYLTSKIANGFQVGKTYADTNRTILTKRIIPYFGTTCLHKISVEQVEDFMRLLSNDHADGDKLVKGLSSKTVRNYIGVLSVMLDEAVRLELIRSNPCKKARLIAKRSRTRGTLTLAEAKAIFANPGEWYNINAYRANLLASVTGMRLSEIRALRCEDVNSDHIHVELSISDRDGTKSTKTGDTRELPIPPRIMDEMRLAKGDRSTGLLFCYPKGKPYGRHVFLDNLTDVLDKHGIDWKTRNIGFHSWRHFLNTQLLSHGISGEKTREITGHATEQMTQRYKHFQLEDYRDILDVTAQLLES